MEIKPNFDKALLGIDALSPDVAIQHLDELTKKEDAVSHSEILQQLIDQLEQLDFHALVYPQVIKMRKRLQENLEKEEKESIRKELKKLKLNNKHYLIITIEQILIMAKKNYWGMSKNNDFIYIFNGAYWAMLDKELFQNFLGEASQKMGVSKFNAKYFQFKESLFKQFLSTAYLPKPELPRDKILINLRNGTFEITPKGTQLRDFNKNDFLYLTVN